MTAVTKSQRVRNAVTALAAGGRHTAPPFGVSSTDHPRRLFEDAVSVEAPRRRRLEPCDTAVAERSPGHQDPSGAMGLDVASGRHRDTDDARYLCVALPSSSGFGWLSGRTRGSGSGLSGRRTEQVEHRVERCGPHPLSDLGCGLGRVTSVGDLEVGRACYHEELTEQTTMLSSRAGRRTSGVGSSEGSHRDPVAIHCHPPGHRERPDLDRQRPHHEPGDTRANAHRHGRRGNAKASCCNSVASFVCPDDQDKSDPNPDEIAHPRRAGRSPRWQARRASATAPLGAAVASS